MSLKSQRTQGLESHMVCEEQNQEGDNSECESARQQPGLGMVHSGHRLHLGEKGCKRATVERRDLKWIG